ncbi:MAG: hypothetical protein J6K89_02815 [Oscillospiraceae bacterium]|nr:hypothetical protein [Oscillospiraceae bacterium]
MKRSKWKRALSVLLSLSLVMGFVLPIQAEPVAYDVDLARGINLVPVDYATDSFIDNYVQTNGESLSLNHRFGLNSSSNVKGAGNTLSTDIMKRDKTDYWWAKYQWTPNELEKQYLADPNYPLIYEGNVVPDYCTHWIGSDHWCKACVRLTSNEWNFGDVDRFGGNSHWYVGSANSNSGSPQAVRKQMDTLHTTTLTYAAYSQKQHNCGNPQVGGSVFYMLDTTVPYITDVSIAGKSYQSLANGNVTDKIILTFSEDVRFADNRVPEELKLNLAAYYGAQAGEGRNENTSYTLAADFVSLVGNKMTFQFTVPQSVNNIYITGITNEQPILESSELYLYQGNGSRLSGPKLTSPTKITDLSGNYLRWDKSDTSCYSVTYDGVAPRLSNVTMSGRDISTVSSKPPTDWNANSGDNRYVYAGAGDTISFTVTYSESVEVPEDAKAVLSIADADGKPIELGIKKHWGNTVVFDDLTITEGMQVAGKRIMIDSFANMTVSDFAGNTLSGDALMTPAQNVSLDVDKPVISTKLTATEGVYVPYAEVEGEYFTVPLKFSETKIPGAGYSDVSGKPIEFTMEMPDGDAYSYWWYIDNTQQVNKGAAWSSATTGTAKNTVEDIAEGRDYYLHIRLDKNTDYNYTDGGMEESGIYFKGKLTVYAEDWAGNKAANTVYTLKHQVDTVAPEASATAWLRMEPNYGNGNVTFSAAFRATDNYNLKRITYQWFYKLGAQTDFSPGEPVILTGSDLGNGLNRSYAAKLSDTYDYSAEENPDSGACYLVVTVEDQLGNRDTITYDTVSFNFTKAKSTSQITVNSATDPMKYPQVILNAPTYENDGSYNNTPRTVLLFPDMRNQNAYWYYDPWEYGSTNPDGPMYGEDFFRLFQEFMEAGGSNSTLLPGNLFYVRGTLDPENNSGAFYSVSLSGTAVSQTGCMSDLDYYFRNFYGPLELYLVTTSSLESFTLNNNPSAYHQAEMLNFTSAESVVDISTVYLAGSMEFGVDSIYMENSEVLNYTTGAPAKNLDNASVSFRLVNTTDTEEVQYGLNNVDFENTKVGLYYTGSSSYTGVGENTEVCQSWNLEPSADGSYTVTVDPGKCVKNGWYTMVLTLSNGYTGEVKTFTLGKLFMDATELDITLDGYYKVYDHEGVYQNAVAWDEASVEADYLAGKEIVLGLDTAPEGWTLDTYLTFNAGGRDKENDPLYWTSFDVQPQIRVYNHTFNTAAGLDDAATGLLLSTDGRNGQAVQYVPYLADANTAQPYEAMKLPFVEGYNLLVYEIRSINGTVTEKELTVNVFGQAEPWELDTLITSKNGVGVNSVTARAIYPSSEEKLRFGYLDSNYAYYTNPYVFTDDMDATFYLIDNQGNLSTKSFALRDENGQLVDIDGEGPAHVGFTDAADPNEYYSTSASFHFTVYGYDYDSIMNAKNMTLTFDPDYSALLMGLSGEERASNTQQITMPIPLAVDENGELLKNEDGTYAVWESYDTTHNGIYRTQVLQEGEYTDPEDPDTDIVGWVEVEIWGTWKYDPECNYDTPDRVLTVSMADAMGNVSSGDREYSAGSHEYSFTPFTLDENGEVNGDLGAVNEKGEVGLASDMPFAAIEGYGAGKQIETIYSYYGYRQFYTTAPMIVEDGSYSFRVTDLFGDEYDLEVYVDAFGELGIDVSYSTTEPTNGAVTLTAKATGEYDQLLSIASDKGAVGEIDAEDPAKGTITVEENCTITIQTQDGKSRVVQVSNIDKVLDPAYIVYYDQNYDVLDPGSGAEAVVAQLVCDTEVLYVTNGPGSYEFPLGSKKGDTYTFEYMDRAGNTGSLTAVLPCDLAAPEERDTDAPEVQVNLFAMTAGRYNALAHLSNPDHGSELNEYLNTGAVQGFRLVFTVNDVSATKILILPAGAPAPEDYATAVEGSTVEAAELSVSGRSATVTVTDNTTFDVHVIDEYGNIRSIPGVIIGSIDNQAPVLTPRYEVSRDENGYAVVIATFFPTEEEKFETIIPLSADVLSKEVQVGTKVDEQTGELIPVMAVRYYYIFTANGSYTFTYQDAMGNIGTAVARVNGLNTAPAKVNQVKWFGTEAPSGQSNVSPDKSGMVNRDVVAQLRMNNAISSVKLYTYDPEAENYAGAPLDATLPVRVSFSATTIELSYEDNVDQQIVVEFTASASGRKGYYTLSPVSCIDKQAPVVTVSSVQMAEDNRSVVITFTTSEETILSGVSVPAYSTEHSQIFTHNKKTALTFTDKAGNRTVYTVTENAEVDALELAAEFSMSAEGTEATTDPLEDLKPAVGATIYVRVNKAAEATLSGSPMGKLEAHVWTALTLPNSAGLHILSLKDMSTGELLQILVAAQPKDNVAPVIELDGSTVLVTADASVEEMLAAIHTGVKVTDNEDKSPALTVTGYPTSIEAGLYTLTYTATDAAGNVTTISRNLYIMAEGSPLLKINGEVGVPYDKVFLKNGGESTHITLELINMEEMTDQPLVIKYRKGLYTTGQMKYSAETVEDMQFDVTGTGHYTIYVRSQDRVEFVIYIYVEG